MTAAEVTHRDLARAAARWLLFDYTWCDVAAFEVGDSRRGHVYDAIACTTPGKAAKLRAARRHPHGAIVECKRTRADLLKDLRAGKLRAYAEVPGVSFVWLAVTWQALGASSYRDAIGRGPELVAELRDRGLPTWWGIEVLDPRRHEDGTLSVPRHTLSAPKVINESTDDARAELVALIARSYSHRVLGSASPLDVADEDRAR